MSSDNNVETPPEPDDTIALIFATVWSICIIYSGKGGGKGSIYNNHPPY